jgi:uncharacterized Zn finger protein (UPF0148 family)
LICPNCKTELVEVNGRYICSGCGREIPENEVMASDWGSGGTVRAGLYGAGTDEVPEEGSKPITDYDTSLAEAENGAQLAPAIDEQTVEEVLQSQTTAPPVEEVTAEPTKDSGFYTPPAVVGPEAPTVIIPEEVVVPTTPPAPDVTQEILAPSEPVLVPEAENPTLETSDEPEVVKDMFENTEIAAAPAQNDPGIYSDPMYENAQTDNPTTPATTKGVPMPADKRNNLIVLIAGFVLVLLFLIGGILAYLYLSSQGI